MKSLASNGSVNRSLYLNGNAFISHMVFQKMSKEYFSDSNISFDNFFTNQLDALVDKSLEKLEEQIEIYYPDSLIGFIFRNYTKCRDLKSKLLSLPEF